MNYGLIVQIFIVFIFIFAYTLLAYWFNVPDCGRGKIDKKCFAGNYIDRIIFGGNHLMVRDQYDPDGLVSTFTAIYPVFIGYFYGKVLNYIKNLKYEIFYLNKCFEEKKKYLHVTKSNKISDESNYSQKTNFHVLYENNKNFPRLNINQVMIKERLEEYSKEDSKTNNDYDFNYKYHIKSNSFNKKHINNQKIYKLSSDIHQIEENYFNLNKDSKYKSRSFEDSYLFNPKMRNISGSDHQYELNTESEIRKKDFLLLYFWFTLSIFNLLLGFILNYIFEIPFNKKAYTLSFAFFVCGISGTV